MLALDKIKTKSILVVGDIMIDRYYVGYVSRISPEAPVPILKKMEEHLVLGGAANTAANLRSANQNVSIASIIGLDDAGKTLIKMLDSEKIDTSLILKENFRHTTVKTRILGQNKQQLFRIDEEDTHFVEKKTETLFLDVLLPQIHKFSLIIISDYMKGVLTYNITSSIINYAQKYSIKVIIDVKDKNIEKYKNAFLIKPNINELRILTGLKIDSEDEVILASNQLRELCACDYVLTTQGSDGMTLVGKGKNVERIRSIAKDVFDVTGAGDTVIAYIGVGIANNLSINDSMLLANYAAGIKVSKARTAPVCLTEIGQYIDNFQSSPKVSKIISLSDLTKTLDSKRLQKKVFTNGCFDILHLGHVKYLREASKLGDILIVGVNSDNSVRRLKGKNRPIISESERMEMLSMFGFIDYIVKFDEDTPINLIKTIRPDVLVKGGDYLPHEVVGKDFVEVIGGKLVLIPLSGELSTTKIIEKIANK